MQYVLLMPNIHICLHYCVRNSIQLREPETLNEVMDFVLHLILETQPGCVLLAKAACEGQSLFSFPLRMIWGKSIPEMNKYRTLEHTAKIQVVTRNKKWNQYPEGAYEWLKSINT